MRKTFLHAKILGLAIMVLIMMGQATASVSFAFQRKAGPLRPRPTAQEGESSFKIVGYVRDEVGEVSEIQFDKVTHLIYAFIVPKSDGSIRKVLYPDKLTEVVDIAHDWDVKVLISVGGYGYDEEFEEIASKKDLRAKFVDEVVDFVVANDLDGVDVDWEFPDSDPNSESAENYLRLLQALDEALGEKLLTVALMARDSKEKAILPGVFEVVDFANIMAYGGPDDQHALYEHAAESLAYWRSQGVPAEQLVLGIPLYALPTLLSYKKLVELDSIVPYQDVVYCYGKNVHYNGIPTVKRKTRLAMEEASGVMMWSLDKDTIDETSLLRAVHETACENLPDFCQEREHAGQRKFSLWHPFRYFFYTQIKQVFEFIDTK